MKFTAEKKQAIKNYILGKVADGEPDIYKKVSEAFEVNQSTIHSYINELINENAIKKLQRGKYELLSEIFEFKLLRESGNLDSDIWAYRECMKPLIEYLPANVKNIWAYAFGEMINNVCDHSQATEADIRIERSLLKTSVEIVDNGVGIFKKIMDYFKLESIDDAICELFKGKLTTDSDNHSGEGIFFTSRLMDEFYIVSDKRLFTNNKFDDSKIETLESNGVAGTKVYMELSNNSNKEARAIFDQYADVEGGFTKTNLILKNFFEDSPVSRSQAKRVCNRLEKFQEAVLDFEGIEWIGQGFAHQIFVIFRREHPEVKIEPVNMCEDVRKMYVHVTKTVL